MSVSSLAAAVLVALAAAGVADPQRGSLATAAQAFDDAQLHHDRGRIDSFLAPDFQYVTRQGRRLDRRAFIANTTTPGEVLQPFAVSDHRVLPLGPAGGVASGDVIVRGTRDGAPFTDRFRYADVFARRRGRWLVVYTQVTGMSAPRP